MTRSITDWLQQSRFTVVSVDPLANHLRVRGEADLCSDLSCAADTVVVTDDVATGDLAALNPGDVVKVEPGIERPERIVVLRRAWEEIASPEL